MIRLLLLILFITCACRSLQAQVNYVRNGDFEQYDKCINDLNEIFYANGWRNASDSLLSNIGMEYYNACGNASWDLALHIPDNNQFWQYPHSDSGMAGFHLYYDKSGKSKPPYPLPYNYRDYLQSHLLRPLKAGRRYCVSFWVNMAEFSGYGQDKIGAYLDDGSINAIADTPGEEITTVLPQVYSGDVIIDTFGWIKIEGSFVASGSETYITLGNFFKNSVVSTTVTNYWGFLDDPYSYYLIDDVSVVESDLTADAGADSWVAAGGKVAIGRTGDTTATALDCKWYHHGVLIDSGAVIDVPANSNMGAIDTYVVLQTLCGATTRDTVLVKTVPLDVREQTLLPVLIYPNPSSGLLHINAAVMLDRIRVYDLTGRLQQEHTRLQSREAILHLPAGNYVVELQNADGFMLRERVVVEP